MNAHIRAQALVDELLSRPKVHDAELVRQLRDDEFLPDHFRLILTSYADALDAGEVLPPAPVTWLGWQETLGEPLALWNLTCDIEGHPVESSVSTQTLEAAGFAVPRPPCRPPAEQAARRDHWHRSRRSSDTLHPFHA